MRNITDLKDELIAIASKNKLNKLNVESIIKELSFFSETNLIEINVIDTKELSVLISFYLNIMRIKHEQASMEKSLKSFLVELAKEIYGPKAKTAQLTINDCKNSIKIISSLLPKNTQLIESDGKENPLSFYTKYIIEHFNNLNIDEIMSTEKASEFIKNIDFTKNNAFSIGQGITTHPVKFDERVRTSENLYSISKYDKSSHGISGFSTILRKNTTISMNAGLLGHRFLLGLEFLFAGERNSFVNMILSDDPIIKETMEYLVNNETYTLIEKEIKSKVGTLNTAIGKQVFFPILNEKEELDHHLISPVISAGFQREVIHSIINELKTDDLNNIFYIPTVKTTIGGAQAQNTSSLNSRLYGINTMFKFTMPPTNSLDSIERKLINGQNLFVEPRILPKTLSVKEVHFKARYSFTQNIVEWCLESMSLFDTYKESISYYEKKKLLLSSGLESKIIDNKGFSKTDKSEISKILQSILFKSMAKNKINLSLDVKENAIKSINSFTEDCL